MHRIHLRIYGSGAQYNEGFLTLHHMHLNTTVVRGLQQYFFLNAHLIFALK
jgi:hypothetical protein